MHLLLSAPLLLCWAASACGQAFNPTPRNQSPRTEPSVVLPRSFTPRSVRDAFETAKEAVTSRRRITGRRRPMDRTRDAPSLRHNIFQRSKPRSIQMGTTQEVFEEATRVLLNEFNLSPEQIAYGLAQTNLSSILQDNTVRECEALFNITDCNPRDRFRTLDGSCNNLQHPTWGMAATCFQRLMDPVYADGTSQLRLAVSGRPLPNPRTISLEIHSHLDNPTEYVTHMFMQWGQFLDHDLVLTPLSTDANNVPLNCCPVEDDAPMQCAPILLDQDDPFYSQFDIDCLNNARSMICSTCTLGPRQQTNQLTAFIDASQVYGNSVNESRGLRTLNGGLMRTQRDTDSGELMPASDDPQNDQCSFQDPNLSCFQAGDVRVNQHPALSSFHTIFLRHHNRIANRLRALNSRWNDERIFQETRRIIGAQMQMITYNEYLPLVIGPERMEWFDLSVRQRGYTEYDPTVEPTLVHEFTTAAFRFGHSMINSMFPEISRNTDSGNRLRDIFLFPFGIYNGQLERIMRGMAESPSQKFDRWMVRDVTNHLYQNRGNQSGLDLASLNVFRGRDHGLPPYVDVVSFCGGPRIRSFQDLDRLFQRNARRVFQSVYESVEDIDLFSGGTAERPNQGAVVGPTFTCIIGIQFYHLKYGDRFYFEHGGQEGSFTPAQLAEIRKTTFAKIICENSDIEELQPNVLVYPNTNRNRVRYCNELPEVNLAAWRE